MATTCRPNSDSHSGKENAHGRADVVIPAEGVQTPADVVRKITSFANVVSMAGVR